MKVKILKIVRILRAAGPELAFLDEYFFHVKQSHCKLKCVYIGCENVYIGCEKVVFMCFIPLKSIFALFDISTYHAFFVQLFGHRNHDDL